jgi:hypothetical protein
MYMPVAMPSTTIPPSISGRRTASARDGSMTASTTFIASPTTTTLLTVPSPGR